jgi:uncharacterized phage protein (TIGR01671 family)
MREIKFRTPLFYKGKFHKFAYWGINVPEKGINSYRPNDGNDYKAKDDEQYTGLKDKNGKEIYEGDIVNFPCKKGREYIEGDMGEVKYREDLQSFIVRYLKPICKEVDNWHPLFVKNSLGETKSKYEVIGNIYENPNLLDKR